MSIYNLIAMNKDGAGLYAASAYSTSSAYENADSFEKYARMLLFSVLFR